MLPAKKLKCTSEGKDHPRTGYEGPEREYNSTLSLTLALAGVGCQNHVSAALTPGQGPGIRFIRG
jgi:hypothetical protein